jgi:hypothetical protein
MDKLNNYRNIIKRLVSRHAAQKPSIGDIKAVPIFDEHRDNYLVVDMGWDCMGRVHSVALHLHIQNEKIWIEVDGTENGVTQELLDAGIPKEDIVLGFYRLERRKLTEFAAA